MTEKLMERVVAALLTAAIVTGAVVLVDSRFDIFRKELSRPDPRAPDYVPDWRDMFGMGMSLGDTGASVQIIEFMDLECPACRELHPIMREIQDRFGEHLVMTYVMMPLPYHRHAESAARAAVCAHRQGKGGEFIDTAFAQAAVLGTRPWARFGAEIDVRDAHEFERCTSDTVAVPLIELGKHLSDSIDITGTPTLIINGWRFESGVPSKTFLIRFIEDLRRGRLPDDTTANRDPVRPVVSHDSSVIVFQHGAAEIARIPRLRLSYSPVTVIRSPPTRLDFDLTGLRRAAVLSDGSVVASVGGARSRVLLFTPDGRPDRVLADWGEGPGDVQYVTGLAAMPGGRVMVVDVRANRVTEFEGSGAVVESRPLLAAGPSLAMSGASFLGVLGDGSIVLSTAGVIGAETNQRLERTMAQVYLVDRGGRVTSWTQVPDLDMATINSEYRDGPRTRRGRMRYSRTALVTVVDSALIVSDGSTFGFDVVEGSRGLVAQVRLERSRRAVTAAMLQASVAADLESFDIPMREAPRDLEASRREVRQLPHADSLPAAAAIFGFPGEVVWVVETRAPTDSVWSAVAYDLKGAALGRLIVPGFPLPTFISNDLVGLVIPDRDGIEQLFVYRVLGLNPTQ